jgi:hypothetical protein
MNSKVLSLLAGVSLLAFAGAASAGDPLTLTGAQLDQVSAGGVVNFDTTVDKDVTIDKDVNIDIDKTVDVAVSIVGNLAEAEASADCFGNNCLAETATFAQTTEWSSEAFSESTAATH